MKEATARIKINKLSESAGWRFFADANGPANIRLEPSVKLKPPRISMRSVTTSKPQAGASSTFCSSNLGAFPSSC